MAGFRVVSSVILRTVACLLMVGGTGLVVAGCSDSESASAQQADAAIAIQTSQLSVLVENRAGVPLTEVDVVVVPIGRATEFTKLVGRLENGEKRDLTLGDFYGRDGTTLSLRVVKPKLVRVTAKDLTNKAYKVEVPWK